MKHDVLGKVEMLNGDPFDAEAFVQYESRKLNVSLSLEDRTLETVLALAAEVVTKLKELDDKAKQVAAAELLEDYNYGWKDYDETQEDGSIKTITNPALSSAEFQAKLMLREICVTGDRHVQFWYDDEGMFWGHSILVQSLRGTDFSDADAQIFG